MSIWTPEEARKFAINCIIEASGYEQSDAEEIVNSIAAMKRSEASEVVGVLRVVTDEDSQYGISAHFSYSDNIAGLAPGDYECYTSPPSKPSTGVPDGWQLVPIEPTQQMLEAAQATNGIKQLPRFSVLRTRYAAMLAAAPRSP